jgi:hypothetical protein
VSRGALRSAVRWREQLPEPGLFWVRWSPRPWSGPEGGVWTDLSRAGIGWGSIDSGSSVEIRPEGRCLEDLIYLPPTTRRLRSAQLALAEEIAGQGTPVLLQRMPGDPEVRIDGVTPTHDLLPTLWHGEVDGLAELPAGTTAVWPLIPGVTDGPALIDRGLDLLAGAGVARAIGIDLELSPGDRREVVVSHGDQLFDLLFHRSSPGERRFCRAAAERGLEWWLDRPLPSPPLLRVGNRRLAGLLLSIADLWSRLGLPPVQGQAYYRAARWIDESRYDVGALLREGNLGLVASIDDASLEALSGLLADGRSGVLEKLRAAWTADPEVEPSG